MREFSSKLGSYSLTFIAAADRWLFTVSLFREGCFLGKKSDPSYILTTSTPLKNGLQGI